MLFGKRTWAVRAVERAGIPIATPVGKQVIELLVHEAKGSENVAKFGGQKMGDMSHVLLSGLNLYRKTYAAAVLVNKAGVPNHDEAEAILKKVRNTSRTMLIEKNAYPFPLDEAGDI